jgi:Family of unknown function (DUF5309)
MAIVANTFTTYDAIGVREQLDDLIFNIAPTDTPFMSGIGKGKAANVFFEWQTDTLASAANNAQLDGDDVSSFTAVTPTVRIGNRTQISRKTLVVSATEQAILKAGRKDEVAYQVTLKMKELKRDMETALCQNTTSVTGNTTTARQTRGLEGWVATNNSLGASGVAPAPSTNTAPTDGTQRAFTEALLKAVAQSVFTAGGDPDMLMVGPAQKQVVSTFTGNATRMKDAKDGELQASISVYTSDFGTFKIAPNRFQRNRTAFLLQTDMWKLMTLRPMQVVDLAKTGDADKKLLVVEYGLCSNQEAGSGAIRDLS